MDAITTLLDALAADEPPAAKATRLDDLVLRWVTAERYNAAIAAPAGVVTVAQHARDIVREKAPAPATPVEPTFVDALADLIKRPRSSVETLLEELTTLPNEELPLWLADLAAPLAVALVDRDVPALRSYAPALAEVVDELMDRSDLLSGRPDTHPDNDPSEERFLAFSTGLVRDLAGVVVAAVTRIETENASAARAPERNSVRDVHDVRRDDAQRRPFAP